MTKLKRLKRIYFAFKQFIAYQQEWRVRIKDVISSDDNHYIPRVVDAGKIKGTYQLMHNGLKIVRGSYYGKGITQMLKKNKGVHEPQEERVFQEVLKILKTDALMVELGAYWSFYSMWFLKEVRDGKAVMYEPDLKNLDYGIANFTLNGFTGDFNHAFIGKECKDGETPTVSLDFIVKDKNIDFIDIVHCDIQRSEFEMLKGARKTIADKKIGYFFISTHSDELHQNCLTFLQDNGFILVAECNLDQTYAVDGLIVAKAKDYPNIAPLVLSKKLSPKI